MAGPQTPPRRRYDSPVRRQRSADTRESIVAAGAEILHEHAVWNWDALTVRGVAERAGVNERTVYRHFSGERELRDAVLARLEQEAGVVLDGLDLDDVPRLTERVLRYVSTFPLEPRTARDSTLTAAHGRQRDALLTAVRQGNGRWSTTDGRIAAGVLDVLGSVAAYERLVADWELAPDEAVQALAWAIGLVVDAIHDGRRPPR
jgi:AcrR family transcriptional regulator